MNAVPSTYTYKRLGKAAVSLASAFAIGCLPIAAAADNVPAKGSIKIGFLISTSGAAAEPGEDMGNAAKLYLDQIHHKMAGRHVELIVENDESSRATAIAKLQKLVEQDKVQVLDGTILSNIAYALAPAVDKYKVPMLFAVTYADDLTKRKRYNWVVRTSVAASQQTMPLGAWAYKPMGFRRVVTIANDYPMGWETTGGFQKTFEDAGGQVIQKLWLPLGFMDFAPTIKEIRKDADAVFISTVAQAAAEISKQYKQFGPNLPVIAVGPSYDETYLRHAGDEAVGVKSVSNNSPCVDNPANKKFVQAYRAAYGVDPSLYAEDAYTSILWINKAVDAVHGDVEDNVKFLDALKNVALTDAPRGPVKMDSYCNPIENIYLRQVEKVNGKLENTVIHTFKNVSQFWTYNPEQFIKDAPFTKDNPPCTHCAP